ncbi:hypothetical protein MD484_g6225, partial [Candolleomyces efflorescens]
MFEGAHHFRMNDLNVTMINSPAILEPIDGWKTLLDKISPNALHNSSERRDPPKCDEGTRVELLRELMTQITTRSSPRRMLCMTGPAGSGKSALQQTIAERCEKSDILGSAYFFENADPTRNTVSTIVPTIAYQLGSHNPTLKQAISAVVAEDTVVFDKSLRVQMETLIVRPLRHLRDCAGVNVAILPYAILIDALDECRDEERQKELLTVIQECLLADDLPFRVFIASRPEMAIRTALEPGGHLHSVAFHIDLSNYYAGVDMDRYLRARFEQLSSRTGDPGWYSEDDIQTLVNAGSGQFIYVTTVYKWISEPRGSPAQRLKIVLRWVPEAGEPARPFEVLDQLYARILLNAKNAYEAVDTHFGRDFLLLFNIHHTNAVSGLLDRHSLSKVQVATCLDLESNSLEILLSDLHSLVSIQRASHPDFNTYLYIHHKSFSDFLNAESRAKDLFVSRTRIYEHLIRGCLRHILQSKAKVFRAIYHLLSLWTSAKVLLNLDDEIIDFTQKGGWRNIDSSGYTLSKPDYNQLFGDVQHLEGIKERNPEVFEEIKMYFEKWKREHDEYLAEKKHKGAPGRTSDYSFGDV